MEHDPIKTISENLDKSYSISASAGCGKTYAIVARVIALLQNGVPLNRILLLTFSENAAIEMQERIIDELKKYIEEKWAKNALNDVYSSSISTFHAFALEICKEYSKILGINNEISLLDELSNEKEQKQFFDKFFNNLGSEVNLKTFLLNSYACGIKRNVWKQFF